MWFSFVFLVPEKFEKLTDEYISAVLADVMLPEDEFISIRDKIKDILICY